MAVRVEERRMPFAICTYKEIIEKFREQSKKQNKSVSRRIEEFMIKELKKEKKNEN